MGFTDGPGNLLPPRLIIVEKLFNLIGSHLGYNTTITNIRGFFKGGKTNTMYKNWGEFMITKTPQIC